MADRRWRQFSEYLEARRKARGLSWGELANALSLPPAYLSRLASGKVDPYPDTCQQIALFFGDPVGLALQLAGWAESEAVNVDEVMDEFRAALVNDPDLRLLFKNRFAAHP